MAASSSIASIVAVVPLIYGIPSLIFNAYLCWLLLRKFKSPFYKLFAYNGILQITYWLVLYFCVRGCAAPVFAVVYSKFPSSGWVPTFMLFLYGHMAYACYVLNFFLHVNRLTVFLFSVRYREIWHRLLPISLVAGCLLPFALTWRMLVDDGSLVYVPGMSSYFLTSSPDVTVANNINSMTFSITYGILALCVESCSLAMYTIRRKRSAAATLRLNDSRDSEIKLCILMILLFSTSLVVFGCQLTKYLHGSVLPANVRLFLNFAQILMLDVGTVFSPWLLVLMSTAVRQELQKSLGRKVKVSSVAWNPGTVQLSASLA